ncbi:MAG: QueT transporter family protein [Candidatus Limivicinus sp.]
MKNKVHLITAAAIIGAAYAVLTIALAPISYGAVQFRLAEALCIMPFFIPGTSWGLFVGCIAANLLTGNIFDVIFGSLATLGAALCTALIGRRGQNLAHCILVCLMPVIFNALIVGAVITKAYNGFGIFAHPAVFAANAGMVGAGEAGVMFLVGLPLMRFLPGKKFFRDFMAKCR